jgi:16S rRNA (guanine966-N2)-methyltransferase
MRNEVRIIGGIWRSRRIAFPDAQGLRPTPDRIRETLFNWLGQDLGGFRCLDLYAGSGALGFEALSRGANRVVFVERGSVVAEALEENATRLQTDRAVVVRADALEFVRRNAREATERFDLIFLDPPFDTGVPAEVLELLPGLLAPGGQIYLESDRASKWPAPWQVEKSGRAGQVHYQLLRLECE